jgi:hypothetical protein
MVVSGFCAGLALRCPWCNDGLSSAVNQAIRIMKVKPDRYLMNLDCVTCCPRCARMLDEKWPARGKAEKFLKKGKSWDDELA